MFGPNNFFLEIQDHELEQDKRVMPLVYKLSPGHRHPAGRHQRRALPAHDDAPDARDHAVHPDRQDDVAMRTGCGSRPNEFYMKSRGGDAEAVRRCPRCADAHLGHRAALPASSSRRSRSRSRSSTFRRAHHRHVLRVRRAAGLREAPAAPGSAWRAPGTLKHDLAEYVERLDREIKMIQQMKFSGYFLIVWDFIRFAKISDIPVGPGRGSAAGSLVGYAMQITDIDPLQYGLLFERFLNPERISMPDIDIDFCTHRRGEVIQYVTEKYGREQVAQIITFGTLGARAAIKDVGRVLDMKFGEVERITKLVPNQLNIKLKEAFEQEPGFDEAAQERPARRRGAGCRVQARRHGAQRLDPRRRRRDLADAAEGTGPALQDEQGRSRHAVRHGRPREARPSQDGLPGPDDAHDHRGRAKR